MSRFAAPIAEAIWDMKYRSRRPTARRSTSRSRTAGAGSRGPWRVRAGTARRKFYAALEDFRFLPAGRILAGAGTERTVTLFNCFVMGTIPDSMGGIFDQLKEAALTMQQGGGIGYDFSTIRPQGRRREGRRRRRLRPALASWMSGTRCAAPSCRPARAAAR